MGDLLPSARPGRPRQPDPSTVPSLRRYVVVGSREVGGVEPGGIVELLLTDAQESTLVEAGHVAPYVEQVAEPAVEEAVEPVTDTSDSQ